MRRPDVSVVIPTYNYGRYIGEAVESALRQTLPPLEIIVVDDGSTDNTQSELRSFAGRITYHRQENSGVSAARNRGIRAARGEWIAMLDADDIWRPEKLALQMQCALNYPEVVLIGGLNQNADTAESRCGCEMYTLFSVEDFLCALPFGTSSAVARRESLIRCGLFKEKRRLAEDRELWLKLVLTGPAARVNAAVWEYRHHSGQSILQARRMAENYAEILREFFKAHPEYRAQKTAALAYFDYDSAMAYHETGANLPALGHTLRSFIRFPYSLEVPGAEARFDRRTLLLKSLVGKTGFEKVRNLLKRGAGRRPAAAT
ncbi:MAG TPA: glycosyltransferase family A protein [Planctomycetota bacterium]|nr:glycosyltransferase family A protein [Planctomycetota bacterium]